MAIIARLEAHNAEEAVRKAKIKYGTSYKNITAKPAPTRLYHISGVGKR